MDININEKFKKQGEFRMNGLFDSAMAANKKIQNVIGKFDGMVKDLASGIQTLQNEIAKNVSKIEELTAANTLHTTSINQADKLRQNIENLLK